ncbi:MAG: iron-containing alcohol dehydrogenase [Peptostreptococcus porci]|uniref:Iron-containing alcohol dehydrogenase n=1 Tax=Peptostreptococcus porci TaxID=2652282 RepID=A0A6N7WYM0_9FIRM|nr:iron-containing alcohol dehydrogenase [Peptostreptococcus porci]MDY2793845.1 iron-containing alcohol dehydrogenase [Peptostreptococcus porci]MDY5479611.1 iron-containing alcohol dehydrogenase [Peptostreptococcus porci]MST61965.1 iron-containing alcohol dehydrogenase [Peptostreptococcus porci]
MWEKDININEIKEIRAKSTAYLGVGAIEKFNDIAAELSSKGFNKVVILTGRAAYKKTGAWEVVEKALKDNNIEYALYDKISPNPEHKDVDEACELGKSIGANCVIGIGGGSPIDAAKSVSILLEYPEKKCAELYELKFTPDKAAPVIAINLTHGTGTEVDRFAVVSIPEKEYKPAIAYDCIYPLYAIDDPALMVTLPEYQTMAVSVDAINHVFEACTALTANPFSILCGKETVRLVHKYLPRALADGHDLEARYYLAYASMIAGTSFDNGLLHFTHALEHPLSAVKTDLTHGVGLGILLPSVVKICFDARRETIIDVFGPLVGDSEDLTAEKACENMREWLKSVGLTMTLKDEGFTEADLDRLTELAFTTPSLDGLLSCAPVQATRENVRAIYAESL